jgi:kynureninase
MYVYEAHARDGKLTIETVKSDDGITVPLERMLAAIDETTLVPFSHVLFRRISPRRKSHHDRAHEVGALVVLDISICRQVPFSVKELDADFATGSSVKWLWWPRRGYLYVRRICKTNSSPKQRAGWHMNTLLLLIRSFITRQT